jgi:hypothetical protein
VEKLTKKISANERRLFEKLFEGLEANTQISVKAALSQPSNPKHHPLSIAVYLAALSRIRLYKRFAGSNPTWVKRPNVPADVGSTKDAIRVTLDVARDFANRLPDVHRANRTSAIWSSIERRSIASGSLDAILTSPPYANRTDYIRHYLPGSEVLLALAGKNEREVRTEQIGTPLIRDSHPHGPLIPSVIEVLERIRTHGSYASERYYHKGFLYYFADMHQALARMRVWLRKRGLLLMVVQDSYYKDIYIPTASLLVDLAESLGFRSEGRLDWPVRQYLSRLSPHSRRTMPTRTLSESVVILSR